MKGLKNLKKLKILYISLFITLSFIHIPMYSFLGVMFVAAQGPSIPKVMESKDVFEKKCSAHESVESSDPTIIQATIVKNKLLLEAKRPGTTTITLYSNGKIKKTYTITVAYNLINEIPETAETGNSIYCVTKKPITYTAIDGEKICKILKKRKGNSFFYEIKFIKNGTIELSDGNITKVIKIKEKIKNKKKK